MHAQLVLCTCIIIANRTVINFQWFERRFIIEGFHIVHLHVIITSIQKASEPSSPLKYLMTTLGESSLLAIALVFSARAWV